MTFVGHNHADCKMRSIRRVRVQRGRRPCVVGVCGWRIRCRRRDVSFGGRSGLGIAPARGDRSGHFSAYQPNTRRTGVVEIVNRRGPQRGAHRNRMATVKSASAQFVGALPLGSRALRHTGCSFVIVLRRGNTMEDLVCRENRVLRASDKFPPLRWPGGGAKTGYFQFRSRHGAEGINTKQERSKQ